ncbi:carboxymuconolactone decarboxylase family protein [Mycolicibacterium litorale]|uniref:Carboxymuconolactone decarboxylase n=1 Tax=Mycolicibacterium litorale TaxID=758802 RepID=A0AAD1MRM4_9MYCO|nr:carboxymuconolactone decarboxylase family protein [Mycolicibacterium litorale]MCV7413954.1 carboxymuconolactone decarboxylase family protein [Mycolicibacterium litorale]TDY03162.1 alkylhydroperoxidase family enzyme [Mycolicibacterium litorale]BBY14955.1 carboxymuconolactone decarboxylase [Mycolicibacterium litorale]
MTRLTPLPPDEWDDGVRDALGPLLSAERANPRDAGNILGTLVRHRPLTRAYLEFNAYLLRDSTLSARIREVALMRAVLWRRCDYLWDHHVELAARAGLTAAEIDGIKTGALDDELDSLVLRAVDELEHDSTIADATWAALGRHLDDPQRMDLVFTIGGYHLLALAVNAFGIEAE